MELTKISNLYIVVIIPWFRFRLFRPPTLHPHTNRHPKTTTTTTAKTSTTTQPNRFPPQPTIPRHHENCFPPPRFRHWWCRALGRGRRGVLGQSWAPRGHVHVALHHWTLLRRNQEWHVSCARVRGLVAQIHLSFGPYFVCNIAWHLVGVEGGVFLYQIRRLRVRPNFNLRANTSNSSPTVENIVLLPFSRSIVVQKNKLPQIVVSDTLWYDWTSHHGTVGSSLGQQ